VLRTRARWCADESVRGGVVAQDASAPGEGVFGQGAGRLVLAQRGQVDGEVVGGGQGVGVIVAEESPAAGEDVLVETARALVVANRAKAVRQAVCGRE
jgi:hypothetical protein